MFRFLIFTLIYANPAAANIKAYFPPPDKDRFPRLRLASTLPNLIELTFCSWLKVHILNGSHTATLISYSTERNNNEFLVLLLNQTGNVVIKVHRGDFEFNADCPLNCQIGFWCHVCVSWFGPTGSTNTFVNGKACKQRFLNFNEPYVPSGGVLVIGQEQDGLDRYYDVKQSWIGDIADVNLWNEVLSEEQIQEAGSCGRKRKAGNVISWLRTPMAVLDGVVLSATQLCSS